MITIGLIALGAYQKPLARRSICFAGARNYWSPTSSVQNQYSVVDRAADPVVDYCERENLGFIPWFPLAPGEVSASGSALERTAKQPPWR